MIKIFDLLTKLSSHLRKIKKKDDFNIVYNASWTVVWTILDNLGQLNKVKLLKILLRQSILILTEMSLDNLGCLDILDVNKAKKGLGQPKRTTLSDCIISILAHRLDSLQGLLNNEEANTAQGTARVSVIPDRYIFGKVILQIFSTEISPYEISLSLFTIQTEKALHSYGLLKEEVKEEAYYCVNILDKELLQIIVHQETPGIKINIYKDTDNQPFTRKHYYVIALFDNLLEDEIAIKKGFRKRNTSYVIAKNTPPKPYFEIMQGTGGKVDVYTNNYGTKILETEEDAALRETLEELEIILDRTKLQKIWSETVPSQLEWTTRRCEIQEAIYNKNQDFIFQEIGNYFNYCEIESLDEQEESDISPMTEMEFNSFKKKTEKLMTKDIVAIEKYKRSVTCEINRLRGRLTKINKYLNNYYGRKYKYSIFKTGIKYRRS
ncbi:hypothetical protein C2G38_2202224 [Gigaspora rosea]|uniref:Nudix hydrolase domain-containing protein n=1 Tax=Gigaspora rosea TaxID=44941 RepID=A0A397UXC8_9GLOM|nr:hypothetical protein C2G38_2202224 [Gigaspora rosea]